MMITTSFRISRMLATISVVGLAACSFAAPEDFVGAQAVIAKVTEAGGKDKSSKSKISVEDFLVEVKRTIAQFATMPADEAGRRWVELVSRMWTIEGTPGEYQSPATMLMPLIFGNIPGPESWPAIQKAALETTSTPVSSAIALQIMAAKLNGDQKEMTAGLKRMKAGIENKSFRGNPEELDELTTQLLNDTETSQTVIERFTRNMEKYKKERSYGRDLLVPDLVAIADETTARPLLLMALSLKECRLKFAGAGKTLALTKQIALENLDKMKSPRWDLVHSLESTELFDAMLKKFPQEGVTSPKADETTSAEKSLANMLGLGISSPDDSDDSDSQKSAFVTAKAYQYLDRLVAGNTAEADRFFSADEKFISSLDTAIDNNKFRLPLATVYKDLSARLDDEAGKVYIFWRIVEGLARTQIDLKNFVPRLATAAEKLPDDHEDLSNYLDLLAKAYLEQNQPEKAAEYLVRMCRLPDNPRGSNYTRSNAATKLLKLGEILDRPEWSDQGLDELRKQHKKFVEKGSGTNEEYNFNSSNDRLVGALLQRGRYAEAEKCLLELMEVLAGKKGNSDYYQQQLLEKLVLVYDRAGRHQDIMVLLTEAPWWNANDIARISSTIYGMPGIQRGQFEVAVARALDQAGHKDEAVDLLKRTLIKSTSLDAAYDALTTMTGAAIVPWLDELATRDRFEERPLMWKAAVLQREGKLAEAEAAAREAIKIDPVDGEQPKGARLKAYEVLADILQESNQTSESKTLKEVVAAVRLAEHGDELNEIGLADLAVQTYEKASQNFSDAYCVEWRLARRLADRGDEEGATRHYEKAFQLMPQQFGRLANLCFGCENIFENAKPQSIAERVLQGMTGNPQVRHTVYDLLGQLREAQNNPMEAAQFYRKAVEADADYYDAWQHLYKVGEEAFMDPKERADVAEQLLRLDPYLKHFQIDSRLEISPKVLWETGERDRKWMSNIQKPLFELTAAKARLETKAKPKSDVDMMAMMHSLAAQMDRNWKGPGQYLVGQSWMQSLMEYMRYNY